MKRFSPWGLVSEGEIQIMGRTHTVFDIGEFAVATFSYNQSVSKNYRNGVLLNSKSIRALAIFSGGSSAGF